MAFSVIDTQGRLKTFQVPTEVTFTTTGNIDNLDFSNADLIRMNNATLTTIRGLKAGYTGQEVTIVSVGAGQVDLAHQNAGSTEANRLINYATSANSSLAAGSGSGTYKYDGTTLRWRLVSHEQGAWITPAFVAGDYTAESAMTWTVAAEDIQYFKYRLSGRSLTLGIAVITSTVGGTLATWLQRVIPGGFTANGVRVSASIRAQNNGVYSTGMLIVVGTELRFYRSVTALDNWATSTNLSGVQGEATFEVS